MKRKIFVFGFLILLSLVALHFYSPYFIVEIRNPIIEFLRPPPDCEYKSSIDDVHGKPIKFDTQDGLKMTAYISYSTRDSIKSTIILLHGIRANKWQYLDMSKKLVAQGFNVVALDLRAHGQSEGRFCTFGEKEKYDIIALVDYLEQKECLYHIGIWGQSLGGAIALQAMAIEPRLQFGIIESTFNNFHAVVNQYTHNYLGFNVRPLTNHVIKRAGVIADFNPNNVVPQQACTLITQPILMAHGRNDERIPIAFGKANFNKLKSQQKEFIEIPSAGHGDLWRVGDKTYFNRVIDFLDKQ